MQPFFKVDFLINSLDTDIIVNPNNYSQLMHVIPTNDPPTLTNPQVGYKQGCISKTPCIDNVGNALPYSVFSNDIDKNFYGQYWRYEGSTDPILITGFHLDDPDVDENCYFDSTSVLAASNFVKDPTGSYFCGTMNIYVRAAIGAIFLNTVDNLAVYVNKRSAIGVVSVKTILQNSLASISYQVETPEIVAAGSSTVLTLNTQHVGAAPEYVLISLQDQGLTGS